MAEEEIGSKEQAPKSNRILFCYFFIVLLLGLVAIGILVRAFDTAFVERGDLDEGGREPEASEPPDLSQPWKYLFFRRQADGDQCALLLSVYRFQRRLLYPSDQEVEQLGYASEK